MPCLILNYRECHGIRARGQHFHEWFEHNGDVKLYSMIKFLNTQKPMEGGFGDVKGHYRDAKWALSNEIETVGLFMESFFKEVAIDQIKDVAVSVKRFNRLVDQQRPQDIPHSAA